MSHLGLTMGKLLPELVSQNGDRKVIEKGAKTLSEMAHGLEKESITSGPFRDDDPSLSIIADQFSTETKLAYRAIRSGNFQYGVRALQGITGYCIACHTRHDKGPSFPYFPLDAKADKLTPKEKADLLIATRQFEEGLKAYQRLIQDEKLAKNAPFEWEHLVARAVGITVRVKNDPAATMEVLNLALGVKNAPDFCRSNLIKWKRSVEAWSAESKQELSSEADKLAAMKKIFDHARANQVFPADRSAEVDFLRASALAHDILRVSKNPESKARGLFVAGVTSEIVNAPLFWPMHEQYYQRCITEAPHTPVAAECYERFEQSVYFGYTGSAGTRIPEELTVRLGELRLLAKPKE